MKKPALLDSEILDRELGYLRRLFDVGLANLDDLLCDHLGIGSLRSTRESVRNVRS